MYNMRESDKHFLWSLLGAIGIVLFWRGIWNGIDTIGEVQRWEWVATPALSLFIGLAILTFSGLIFREFDPLGGLEKGVAKALHALHEHPHRDEFTVTYYDQMNKKEYTVGGENIKRFEKNVLSVHEGERELFIPIHRIRAVHHKGKMVWRV